MVIELKNKSGFFALSDIIIIYDKVNKPFYIFDFTGRKKRNFNLPKGIYNLKEGEIKAAPFNKWTVPKLPPAERNRKIKNFKVYFEATPNKAEINFLAQTIKFDLSYKNAPKIIFDFTLFHEHGHAFYKTEHYCDLYAIKRMLIVGYNPSQVLIAQNDTLTLKKSDIRKNYVFKQLEKINLK